MFELSRKHAPPCFPSRLCGTDQQEPHAPWVGMARATVDSLTEPFWKVDWKKPSPYFASICSASNPLPS